MVHLSGQEQGARVMDAGLEEVVAAETVLSDVDVMSMAKDDPIITPPPPLPV